MILAAGVLLLLGCAHHPPKPPPPAATLPADIDALMKLSPEQLDDVLINVLAHFDFGGFHLADLSNEEFESMLVDDETVAEKIGAKTEASRAIALMRAARRRAIEEATSQPSSPRATRPTSATTRSNR